MNQILFINTFEHNREHRFIKVCKYEFLHLYIMMILKINWQCHFYPILKQYSTVYVDRCSFGAIHFKITWIPVLVYTRNRINEIYSLSKSLWNHFRYLGSLVTNKILKPNWITALGLYYINTVEPQSRYPTEKICYLWFKLFLNLINLK